jgi:hypothetical protein
MSPRESAVRRGRLCGEKEQLGHDSTSRR